MESEGRPNRWMRGTLWSITATTFLEKQKGYLPPGSLPSRNAEWEQDVALSNACHFLIFQDNLALEEEICEPIPRHCPRCPARPARSARLSRALPLVREGPCRVDVNRSSAYKRVSGEEIARR